MCQVVLVTGSVVPLTCSDGQTIAQVLGTLGDRIKPGLVFYKVVDSITGVVSFQFSNSNVYTGKYIFSLPNV